MRALRYNRGVSRLRRLCVSGKLFFITCNPLPTRIPFLDADLTILAEAIGDVRKRRGFLLGGYVLMPDHWHALIYPAQQDTLPPLMDAIKVASMRRIDTRRGTRGRVWQPRYFDEIVWTVKQFHETLKYMQFNPVEKGLVARPEDWPWSSFHCFGGDRKAPLEVDPLELPADENARL